ncbi:hypothetical protein HYQ46_000470 [Verticillium longisporum]|nr:hypothetical protein HYQ46_000470 [Verticillium longisporum]
MSMGGELTCIVGSNRGRGFFAGKQCPLPRLEAKAVELKSELEEVVLSSPQKVGSPPRRSLARGTGSEVKAWPAQCRIDDCRRSFMPMFTGTALGRYRV